MSPFEEFLISLGGLFLVLSIALVLHLAGVLS